MGSGLRHAVAILAMVLLLVAFGRQASALSCVQQTIEQQVDAATAVFIGRVTRNVALGDVRLVTFSVTYGLEEVRAGAPASVWSESSKWQWPFGVGDSY